MTTLPRNALVTQPVDRGPLDVREITPSFAVNLTALLSAWFAFCYIPLLFL